MDSIHCRHSDLQGRLNRPNRIGIPDVNWQRIHHRQAPTEHTHHGGSENRANTISEPAPQGMKDPAVHLVSSAAKKFRRNSFPPAPEWLTLNEQHSCHVAVLRDRIGIRLTGTSAAHPLQFNGLSDRSNCVKGTPPGPVTCKRPCCQPDRLVIAFAVLINGFVNSRTTSKTLAALRTTPASLHVCSPRTRPCGWRILRY